MSNSRFMRSLYQHIFTSGSGPLIRWRYLWGVLTVLVSSSAWASTFLVTSAGDFNDLNPGDGVCEAGTGCTLRAAAEEANAWPGADRIEIAVPEVVLRLGSLLITDDVSIVGIHTKASRIRTTRSRQLTVLAKAAVSVDHLTLHQGGAGYGDRLGQGGCIYNAGILSMTRTNLDRCYAIGEGGGIYNEGSLMLFEGTTFSNNFAFAGGGIYNAGSAYLEDTYFWHNRATGLDTDGDGKGDTGGGGSVAYNEGVFFAKRSTFASHQTRKGLGGGILNMGGNVDLENVTFAKNRCRRCEGGAIVSYGGSIHARFTTIDRTQSAFSGGVVFRQGTNFRATHVLIAGHNTSTEPDWTCFDDGTTSFNVYGPSMDDALLGYAGGCSGFIHTADVGTHILNHRGGFVPVIALKPWSPALDAGEVTSNAVEDARGYPRPKGRACDIGAFEVQ